MYLTFTILDLMYAMSLVSRYKERNNWMHLSVARRIIRCMKGTMDFWVFYKNSEASLKGYTYNDHAGDVNDKKSTSGYVFLMSERVVFWCLKK